MTWWPKLLPHQLDLLRRIAEGAEPVTSGESTLVKSVYALRSRKLVTTPRSGGIWTALITDGGRYYLEHGRYTALAEPRSAEGRLVTDVGQVGRVPSTGEQSQQRPTPDGVLNPAEIIRHLHERGTLRITDPQPAVRAEWRRSIQAAKEQSLVPDGYHLRHHGRDRGDLIIELIAGDHPGERYRNEQRQRIPVPDDLDDVLPVVRDLRREPERLKVSANSVPRALRLVQALAAEAERRGHAITLPESGPGLLLVVKGHSYPLLMNEEWDRVDHLPGPDELDNSQVYPWQRIQPQARSIPSGRLTLEIAVDSYKYAGRVRRFADRRRWRLDDKLGDVLSEVEARADIDEQKALAAERAKADRQRQWEKAMDRARARYVEAHYVKSLDRQLDNWKRARAARAYVAALKQGISGHDMTEAMSQWISWIQEYADRIDPLLPEPQAPPMPAEPRGEDLRPYLGRWSPCGPEASY